MMPEWDGNLRVGRLLTEEGDCGRHRLLSRCRTSVRERPHVVGVVDEEKFDVGAGLLQLSSQ